MNATSSLLALDISKEPVVSLDAEHADGRTAFPFICKVQDNFYRAGEKAIHDAVFSSGAVRVTGAISEIERSYHASRGGFLSSVRADPKLGIEKVEIIRSQKGDNEDGDDS